MGEFSLVHWLIVLGILLIIFGPSKLPQLGSSLGIGMRNFRKSLKEIRSIDEEESEVDEAKNRNREKKTV